MKIFEFVNHRGPIGVFFNINIGGGMCLCGGVARDRMGGGVDYDGCVERTIRWNVAKRETMVAWLEMMVSKREMFVSCFEI